MQALVQRGEGALMSQVKAKAEAELDKAKNQHKEAYESGDSERLTDATEQMLSAQSELKVANDHFSRLEAHKNLLHHPTYSNNNHSKLTECRILRKLIQKR